MRLLVELTLLLCVVCAVPSSSFAAKPFSAPFYVEPVGHGAVGVVAGNFGGSPSPDLVAISSDAYVLYLGGRGNGTFFPRQEFALNSQAFHLIAGDLDHDGRQDVVIATASGLVVLFGPAPGFARVNVSGPASRYVGVGDYDGNGLLDVAAVSDSGIQVYSQTSLRVFLRTLSLAASPGTIGMGDFNEDGYADIVCDTHDAFRPLALYLSDTFGNFSPAQLISAA